MCLSKTNWPLNKYLLTSRFSTRTWNENELYRKSHAKIGCIYCSEVPITQEVTTDKIMFVLEMNNDLNSVSNRGDTGQYHGGLRSRELGQVIKSQQLYGVEGLRILILYLWLHGHKGCPFVFHQPVFKKVALRLGAQRVTLLSTLRDPTQLR